MTGHTTNPVLYVVIFAALIALTFVTVTTAQAPIGDWHAPLALGIATVKTVLVVLFFMHVLHGERLTWAVILTATFMLALLTAGVLADYLSRPWLTT